MRPPPSERPPRAEGPPSRAGGSGLVELTRFIGRERELDAVLRLLESARLLTLTGAGGSGKTRLALEVLGKRAGSTRERTVWVELASLRDPGLVPQRIVESLGLREELPPNDPEALATLLGSEPLLLVLDNCEHLVDGCASLAEALIRLLPELRVLATSREALGVKGERAWLVPPLSLPPSGSSLAEMEGSEAVRLFVDRARDTVPGFTLTRSNADAVAEICTRLDGIPLAVELAAARVKVLPPEQIRDRLDDVFHLLTSGGRTAVPRHRTLRAAIDWSHDLLPEDGRILLRRLSVFRQAFTLDAAEAVGAGGGEDALDETTILDAVARLVDRSLLQVGEAHGTARYRLLETIRKYARERLAQSGEEEEVRRRHARFMADEVSRTEPHLTRPERREWVDRMLSELEDLRTALAWTRDHDPTLHLRMAGDLWWFWYSTRYWMEGGRWIREALALPQAREPGRNRAMLLFAAGALATLQGRADEGRSLLEESVELARDFGNPRLEAYGLTYIGLGLGQRKDPGLREPVERALAWFRANDDLYGLRLALLLSALAAQFSGEPEEADRLSREAIDAAREFGQDRELAIALQNWAVVEAERGDQAHAEALVLESLRALRADPSYLFLARGIEFLGEVAGHRDAPLQAARLFGVSESLRASIGATPFELDAARVAAILPRLRELAGEGAFREAWDEGSRQSWEAVVDELLRAEPAAPPRLPAPEAAGPPPAEGPPDARDERIGGTAALQVRALGPFEVEVDGGAIDAESWSYARPRELLVYLLLNPRGGTRDEIGLALWPEAAPAQLKNSFHVTLHHLRKRLGQADWVVMEGDRYRLTPDRRVEWDGGTFHAGIRDALRRARSEGVDPDALRKLLALYRGDLLEGTGTGRWLEEARDHFRRMHADGRMGLARALEARGDLEEAAEQYQEVLRHEELNEEAHRGLMAAWAADGHRDRALRHFDRLELVLRETLEALPEEEPRSLHRRILGS
jgi:predicted ATPase/DNA-binding SARP family transcriptional activator